MLRKIAGEGLAAPVTLVLDIARYQHNEAVKALAKNLNIELLFLPGYSPNRNLIERLWRFIKREALYGRYHACFADFKAAIEEVIDQMPTRHKGRLASLLTLDFQVFHNVSLLAA